MISPAQALPSRRGKSFYVAVAVISAAIVFLGFSRTFYLNPLFARLDLSALRIVHGVVFSLWLVLLVAQTTLVAARRTDLHRRLGAAGAVLAALMIVVGMAMAVDAARNGVLNPSLPPPVVFFVVPFFDIVVFTILIAAAFLYRSQPEFHKRLMIAATISILPPAIARLPVTWPGGNVLVGAFVVADVVLLACIAYDAFLHRRLHRAWVWSGLLVVLSFPLRLAIGGTAAWQAFARWVTS